MPVMESRLALLDSIYLLKGTHLPNDGKCALEAVAWLAGEKHTDHPVCVSPVLADFCRNWNDNLDDANRQKLKPYLARLIGTAGDAKADELRAWMAMDWLTRECGPAFMDLTPALTEYAAELRAMPEITDKATLRATERARAAALHAARAAAGAAALHAARAAAGDAGAAALHAAGAGGAGAAALPTLDLVVARLQDSAFKLLDRMIEAKALHA